MRSQETVQRRNIMKKAAFIFLCPGSDPDKDRKVVKTEYMELSAIPVENYAVAARVAGELADQGIGCIELCGGFGIKGMYLVKEAVGDRAQIGAVRFDAHPGLNFESGDKRFDQ